MTKKVQSKPKQKPRRSSRVGKDILERILTSDLDVAATILNYVFHDGRQVIQPKDLQLLREEQTYPDSHDHMRELRRDAFFLWKERGIVFSFIGLESQSAIDLDMPLRCFSYDGLSYREQIDNSNGKRYPVITFVLYYGEEPWTKCLLLSERLELEPEVMNLIRPYFTNYKVNIIDVRRLTSDDLKKLRGVFAFIAYCFYANEHPDEEVRLPQIGKKKKDQRLVVQFLKAFLRIEDVDSLLLTNLMEGEQTMADYMETTIRYHREEGFKEGVAQERKEREKERKEYEKEKKEYEKRSKEYEKERKEYEKRNQDAARAMAQDGLTNAKIAKYLRVDKATLDAWLAEK